MLKFSFRALLAASVALLSAESRALSLDPASWSPTNPGEWIREALIRSDTAGLGTISNLTTRRLIGEGVDAVETCYSVLVDTWILDRGVENEAVELCVIGGTLGDQRMALPEHLESVAVGDRVAFFAVERVDRSLRPILRGNGIAPASGDSTFRLEPGTYHVPESDIREYASATY
jgi:hypothetical protein